MSQSQDEPDDQDESWVNKQSFMTRFISELGTTIDNKAAEFDIPPVVIIGALEILKQEWMLSTLNQNDDDSEEDQ